MSDRLARILLASATIPILLSQPPIVSTHSPFLGNFYRPTRTLHQHQQSLRRPGEDCSSHCGTASASALVDLGTKIFTVFKNFVHYFSFTKSRKVLARNKLIIINAKSDFQMSLQAVTSSDFHLALDIQLKNIFGLNTRVLSGNSFCHCHWS